MILIEVKTEQGINKQYISNVPLKYFEEKKSEAEKDGQRVDHITAKEIIEIFPVQDVFYM